MPKSKFPKIGKNSGKLEKIKNKKDVHQLQHRDNQAAKWVKKHSAISEKSLQTHFVTYTHTYRRGRIL